MSYRPLFTGLGVIAGYLVALLGLSFYARRRIGTRLWRRMHRFTIVVYVLAVVHTLGAGTDASAPWLRGAMLVTGAPILFLFLRRVLPSCRAPARRSPARRAASRPRTVTTVSRSRVVIAGGGLAAQRAAEALRAAGHEGSIRMVCEEPHAPYDRPPLSKELLAGTMRPGELALRPAGWHARQRRRAAARRARRVGSIRTRAGWRWRAARGSPTTAC